MPFKKNLTALEAPAHPHEFPRIAKEMGFSFSLRRGRVDWYKIDTVNVDRLIQDRDLLTLQDNLLNVINYNLDSEYDVKILDQNFVKLFKLAQLSIDYLMYSEQHLYNCIELLHENDTRLSEELKEKKAELEKMEEYVRMLKKRIKEKNYDSNPHMSGAGDQSKCDHCGKTFLNSVYLAAHCYRRHPSESPPLSPDEPTASLRAEIARLQAEMHLLRERTRLLDAGDATRRQSLGQTREATQRAAEEWQEKLERKYQEQFTSLKSMLLGELRNLQKAQAEGVRAAVNAGNESMHHAHLLRQPETTNLQENAAFELESLTDLKETFTGMLNGLQQKYEKEIEDLRAQVKKNERNKKFDTESQTTLYELVEHEAKQDEKLTLQAKQIFQLSQQKMYANLEPTPNKLAPSAAHRVSPTKSGSTTLPITVHKPLVSQPKKSSSISHKVFDLEEPLQTLNKQSMTMIGQNIPPKSITLTLPTVSLLTVPDHKRNNQQTEARASPENVETYHTSLSVNSRKTDVEIADISSAESSENSASSDDTISNDIEQTNVEYFDGRQSPDEINKVVVLDASNSRDGEDAGAAVLNDISRDEIPQQEVPSNAKAVSDRLESLLQQTGVRVMFDAGKQPLENLSRSAGIATRKVSESIYERVDDINVGNRVRADLGGKREGDEKRDADEEREDDQESEVTVTEDSTTGQSSVDLAMHSAVSLADAVAKNPQVLAELKVDISKQFERRLHELGVDPEWRGIPLATLTRNMETVKHHANITSKRYRSYFKIRDNLVDDVERKLSRLKQNSGSGDGGKKRSNRRRQTTVPVSQGSKRPVGDGLYKSLHRVQQGKSMEVDPFQALTMAERNKSGIPKKHEKHVTLSSEKRTTQAPRITPAFTSTPVKSNNFFREPSNDMHSPVESIDSDNNVEFNNENVSAIENSNNTIQTGIDKTNQRADTTFVKSSRNLRSKSDNFLDVSLKPRTEVSPRGVLKGASSTGSLITKKRVLFVDQDDSPNASPPVAAIRRDIPHSAHSGAGRNVRTIGLLGEGYDSDFDISSGPDTDEEDNTQNYLNNKPNTLINTSSLYN